MITIEIIMIIIGLLAVIASFVLSDDKKSEIVKANVDEEEIEEKINQAVKKTEESIMKKADEKFSQISNDKIMGFNEYSQEVFDKIEKNHEETVFLYNMLTEKEKEIQNLVHNVDTTNAGLRDEAAKTYQEVKKQLSSVDNVLRQIEVENVKDMNNSGDAEVSAVLDDDEVKAIAEITESGDSYETNEYEQSDNAENREENNTNSNSEIIALYKKGRSVLEISKMLSIGQGEVKLVIDLYNSR